MRRALIAFLLCTPAVADIPPKPLAFCDKGKCVMSEADFVRLREFHKASMEAAQVVMKERAEMANEITKLQTQINRSIACGIKS